MANITVVSSGYVGDDSILQSGTWAALVRGDTVTIGTSSSSVILRADPGVRTPTGIDVGAVWTVTNFSNFRLENTSATGVYTLYGNYQGALRFTNGSIFSTRASLKTIYTGNGLPNQTITWSTASGYSSLDDPGGVIVSYNGVDTIWPSIGTKELSAIGVGELGDFIRYDSNTITFGDGGTPVFLTASAAAGQKVVAVSSATGYVAGNTVHIIDSNGNREDNVVASVSGNDITMTTNLLYTYATSSFVRKGYGGNILPNGAVVKTYNINVGTKNETTALFASLNTDNFTFTSLYAGTLDIDGCNLSGVFIYLYGASRATIKNVIGTVQLKAGNCSSLEMTNICLGFNKYETVALAPLSIGNVFLTCRYSKFVTSKAPFSIPGIDYKEFYNTCFYDVERSSESLIVSDEGNRLFDNCSFVGTYVVMYSKNRFKNCKYSDTCNSVPMSPNFYAFLRSGDGASIQGFSLIQEGAKATSEISIRGCLTIDNLDLPSKSAFPLFQDGSGTIYRNCKVGGTSNQIVAYLDSPTYSIQLINFKTYGYIYYTCSFQANSLYKQVDYRTRDVPNSIPAVITDTSFYEYRHSDTVGSIGIVFVQQKEMQYYTVSDPSHVFFNGLGNMYIPVNNGWIEWEIPWWIIGITGYPSNGTINIAGSNETTFTIQVSINLGSGWSDLETIYSAGTYYPTVLSSKTIVNARHKLRVRISKASGNITDYINRLNFQTNLDYENYNYPISEATLTLSGIVEGTEVRIFDSSGNELAGTESAGVTGIFEYTYGYDADVEVRVEIISVAYKNKSFNLTLREYDQSVVVQQEPDNTYLNPE